MSSPAVVVDGDVDVDAIGDSAVAWVEPDPASRLMAPAPWVVAAMAKNVFLSATETWAERLQAAGRATVDLRADRARRADLLAAFAAGPRLVLYAGHGRPRGWGGYQALRIHHFGAGDESAPHEEGSVGPVPVGLVMAFACSTLDRSTDRVPFGQLLVDRGVTETYLAPRCPVVTAEAEALADLVIEVLCEWLAAGVSFDVGGLIEAIDDRADGTAASAWATFELVGDRGAQLVD